MATDPENTRETRRELLWLLKERLDSLRSDEMGHVSFRLLLTNSTYRKAVLRRAQDIRDSWIAQILRAFEALPEFEPEDTHKPAEAANAAEGVESLAALEDRLRGGGMAASVAEGPRMRRRLPRAVPVLIAASLLIFAASMWGLYSLYRWTYRVQHVTTDISRDTVWKSGNTYVLDDMIYVTGDAVLRIEPGVRVTGAPGSGLVVTRNARLEARGTAEMPIVFTSARREGERRPGDWGGLVLLGNAPTNQGQAQIEGLDEHDPRGAFGGTDATSNCGVLEYVRIEFAGYEAYVDNELNGLTLGGCGSATTIHHVQVHRALDDGIEVFGGRPDFRHILITGPGDDGFDWDMGWQGRVQYLIVHQYPGRGDNGFEGDNDATKPDATPRSLPHFENVTLIANRAPDSAHRGMTVRRGSGGRFGHFIMLGHDLEAIDLRGRQVAELIRDGDLDLKNSILFQIGPDGHQFFADERKRDDDGGVDEARVFSNPQWNNRFGENPALLVAAFSLTAPDYVPRADSVAGLIGGRIPEGEFWDESANFAGALRPGSTTTWLDGWTAFPES